MSVFLDLQGVQSRAHAERGIARYLVELARALERLPEQRVARYLLNRHLPRPSVLDFLGPERVATSDRIDASAGGVFHLGSLFESEISLEQLWPRAARRLRLVVTIYDLIPDVFPEHYLQDVNNRRRYRARLELVRHADAVLAISESTARDAVDRLGLRREKVHVVGAGVSEHFRGPPTREVAFEAARGAMPWLESEYILYTGGIDHRKNVDGLLAAYALLPQALRERHQLVVVCRVTDEQRSLLDHRLQALGIAPRVRFPGFVADEELLLLYQATTLFVFPSLYEGFGLPVAEALACGAPVVAARTSSLPELVQDEAALFDPFQPASIAESMERALTDDDFRTRLQTSRLPDRWTWASVAEKTAAVYGELSRRPRRARRGRTRIAYFSPLPPNPTGVADYSYRLLPELAAYCDVDVFFDDAFDSVMKPPGLRVEPIRKFEAMDAASGGYDEVLYCLGNSEFHASALGVLRRRPGVVLAHDVRLIGAYWWLSVQRDSRPEQRSFQEALHAMYSNLPESLGQEGGITFDDAERHGIYMAREAIGSATRFLVHSRHAAHLASLDAGPDERHKIGIVPFGCPAPDEFPATELGVKHSVVATFGIVAPVKQIAKIVEAFAIGCRDRPDALLAVVGRPVAEDELDAYLRQADELGIRDRIRVTGALERERYLAWLSRATLAVQLRALAHGESSAAVGECLAAGVPTITTDLGASAELPDSCVVKVLCDVTAAELGTVIANLLEDDVRREALRRAGIQYAREHSFSAAAEALYRAAVLGETRLAA